MNILVFLLFLLLAPFGADAQPSPGPNATATLGSPNAWLGPNGFNVCSLTDPATGNITFSASKCSSNPNIKSVMYQSITLTGNRILTFPTDIPSGMSVAITFYIVQDSTGSRTLTVAPGYSPPGGLQLSVRPNAVDSVTCLFNQATLTASCGVVQKDIGGVDPTTITGMGTLQLYANANNPLTVYSGANCTGSLVSGVGSTVGSIQAKGALNACGNITGTITWQYDNAGHWYLQVSGSTTYITWTNAANILKNVGYAVVMAGVQYASASSTPQSIFEATVNPNSTTARMACGIDNSTGGGIFITAQIADTGSGATLQTGSDVGIIGTPINLNCNWQPASSTAQINHDNGTYTISASFDGTGNTANTTSSAVWTGDDGNGHYISAGSRIYYLAVWTGVNASLSSQAAIEVWGQNVTVVNPATTVWAGTVSGTNTYAAALSSPVNPPFTLIYGNQLCGIFANVNTGASTLNINAIGAVSIQKWLPNIGLTALTGGEIGGNNIPQCLQYNGASFVLVEGTAASQTIGTSGATLGLLSSPKTDSGNDSFSSGVAMGPYLTSSGACPQGEVILTPAATVTPNLNLGNIFCLSPNQNTFVTLPTGAIVNSAQQFLLRIMQPLIASPQVGPFVVSLAPGYGTPTNVPFTNSMFNNAEDDYVGTYYQATNTVVGGSPSYYIQSYNCKQFTNVVFCFDLSDRTKTFQDNGCSTPTVLSGQSLSCVLDETGNYKMVLVASGSGGGSGQPTLVNDGANHWYAALSGNAVFQLETASGGPATSLAQNIGYMLITQGIYYAASTQQSGLIIQSGTSSEGTRAGCGYDLNGTGKGPDILARRTDTDTAGAVLDYGSEAYVGEPIVQDCNIQWTQNVLWQWLFNPSSLTEATNAFSSGSGNTTNSASIANPAIGGYWTGSASGQYLNGRLYTLIVQIPPSPPASTIQYPVIQWTCGRIGGSAGSMC